MCERVIWFWWEIYVLLVITQDVPQDSSEDAPEPSLIQALPTKTAVSDFK